MSPKKIKHYEEGNELKSFRTGMGKYSPAAGDL